MFAWRWLLTVSCVGQPLCADTSQILLRPLMLLMKAICLPSGDHVLFPTLCDMNSLSMLSGCTSNFSLDVICVGFVMTAAEGGVGVCEKAWIDVVSASTNHPTFRRYFILCRPSGALVLLLANPAMPRWAAAVSRLRRLLVDQQRRLWSLTAICPKRKNCFYPCL